MLPCLCPILGLWAQGEVVSTSHSFLFSPSLRRREWNPDCALDIACLSFRFSPRFTEALPQRKACTTGRREVFRQIWGQSHIGAGLHCDASALCLKVQSYTETWVSPLPFVGGKNTGHVPIRASSSCTKRAWTLSLLERCRECICLCVTSFTLKCFGAVQKRL